MTHKEKRLEHKREMKWLIKSSLGPMYLFMFTIPILVAMNAHELFYKWAIERLAYGSLIGMITIVAYVFLKEMFGYRLGDLPKYLRWKFEHLRDW